MLYVNINDSRPHRHIGDLGNVETNAGKLNLLLTDDVITLRGDLSVIGKAVVVRMHPL